MKIEIERKFLIDIGKIGFDIEKYPKKRYIQAYISTNPTIRLRNEGGCCVLCVKSAGSLLHEEFELPLEAEQFEELWKKTETPAVIKDRYFIPITGGLTAELDIYTGQLAGLATVEVEFETVEEAESFLPPSWFGKDVTTDFRYKNTSLAKHGLPD